MNTVDLVELCDVSMLILIFPEAETTPELS